MKKETKERKRAKALNELIKTLDDTKKICQTKEKNLCKKLPDNFTIEIHKSEDGGFWAKVKELQGCYAQGEDIKDLFKMLEDAIKVYLG